ncbi:hypothetical protein FACS1894122_15680 [Alphaproteobacteria bacterium]|nr:hypothetical protein FACS1894122_15680 [Alphaproteobacteria bacterium]
MSDVIPAANAPAAIIAGGRKSSRAVRHVATVTNVETASFAMSAFVATVVQNAVIVFRANDAKTAKRASGVMIALTAHDVQNAPIVKIVLDA